LTGWVCDRDGAGRRQGPFCPSPAAGGSRYRRGMVPSLRSV